MFTIRRFGMLSVASALVLTFALPTGDVSAATNTTARTYSMIDSIFKQVGLEMPRPGSNDGGETNPPDDNSQGDGDSSTEEGNAPAPTPSEPDNEPAPEKPEEEQNNDSESGNDEENTALADQIIATGKKYLGTPYQYGAASGQTNTFDCSSFTQYVFNQHGIDLPRSSRQQYQVGTPVAKSDLQKGDLLFFRTSSSGSKIGHVAIYAGNNQVLHTWGSKGVHFESLDSNWLQAGYVGAKRVINQ